ncbi:hypothetical protein P7K49_036739 [Saguinus oedipus]|uniref:Uncharacterized protein n=1 Tax=Saguinus oedipus TaxID=9490 RepID=A0ABQ9TKZ9_SAGOE|nr:hypothetical protein P7K49_036739 [Saguinus oedipus]
MGSCLFLLSLHTMGPGAETGFRPLVPVVLAHGHLWFSSQGLPHSGPDVTLNIAAETPSQNLTRTLPVPKAGQLPSAPILIEAVPLLIKAVPPLLAGTAWIPPGEAS